MQNSLLFLLVKDFSDFMAVSYNVLIFEGETHKYNGVYENNISLWIK